MKLFSTVRFLSNSAARELTGKYAASTSKQSASSSLPLQIRVTDRAIQRLQYLRDRYGDDAARALRVRVDSGGCHGFQYNFELIEASKNNQIQDGDIVFDGSSMDDVASKQKQARLVIDDISFPYVAGCEIDFEQALIGAAFKISSNPNAASECGCKISFQAKS